MRTVKGEMGKLLMKEFKESLNAEEYDRLLRVRQGIVTLEGEPKGNHLEEHFYDDPVLWKVAQKIGKEKGYLRTENSDSSV